MTAEAIMHDQQYVRQTYDVIVVGMGPVGLHFIQQLTGKNSNLTIAVFGDEPWEPYDRIKLSSFISGEIKENSLYTGSDLKQYSTVKAFYNNRIESIDRYANEVIDAQGKRYGYGQLVLATGSRPHIPAIEGHDIDNVFCFRDLNDAFSLMGRSVRTRSTVVIGGGLLGLEAARAMQRFNTQVHVIEHEIRLMFNQLDEKAAEHLNEHVIDMGIKVHLAQRVQKITGVDKVEGIELGDGTVIQCDTVILATGIIPNVEVAVDSGLHIGRGIRVNDVLQTNDKDIFAIGECAEHNGEVYGLVGPGFEQASVLADIVNGQNSLYKGSVSATHLKVVGLPVFSIGLSECSAFQVKEYTYKNGSDYRKIITRNGKLCGVIGVGNWPGSLRFQEAVEKQRRIWPWQSRRFISDGVVWSGSSNENVSDWPASATVCNCRGVTRGQLDVALKTGISTAAELANKTGASTVCGSCSTLLCDYMGGYASREPVRSAKALLIASAAVLFAVLLFFFFPSMKYSDITQNTWHIDTLWRDGFLKQVSGFSILGVSAIISVISFRKRIKKLDKLWDYSIWRTVHVFIGLIVITLLIAHTGFRIGNQLNFYLMIVFCTLLLVGALASVVISLEHNIPGRLAKQLRLYAVWSHILLLWPLPGLLGFHIIKTYYF